jgi:hypothetical protein
VTLLTAGRVRIHQPDEAIARRVATLPTSLADGFAAATAQELESTEITPKTRVLRRPPSSRSEAGRRRFDPVARSSKESSQ